VVTATIAGRNAKQAISARFFDLLGNVLGIYRPLSDPSPTQGGRHSLINDGDKPHVVLLRWSVDDSRKYPSWHRL
jgi:hypothetical protein